MGVGAMLSRRELIDYCLAFPGAYEDYPFDEEWTAMRHRLNKKTFAFIYERNGNLCVNLKCEPMHAEFLREVNPSVTPAYHMNKVHWNTVTISDSLAEEDLYEMIVHSYRLIMPKIKKQERKQTD